MARKKISGLANNPATYSVIVSVMWCRNLEGESAPRIGKLLTYRTTSFAERLIERRLLKPRRRTVKAPLANRIDRENRRSLLVSAFFQKRRARREVAE